MPDEVSAYFRHKLSIVSSDPLCPIGGPPIPPSHSSLLTDKVEFVTQAAKEVSSINAAFGNDRTI